jgi:hypothetical protein
VCPDCWGVTVLQIAPGDGNRVHVKREPRSEF